MYTKNLPEPERIARLPKHNGFPVTATTAVENGVPNFKQVDSEKVWQFKQEKRCAICGEALDYWIAFMVTPAEVESRKIFESPMHEECLRHAFKICPWLFWSKANYSPVLEWDEKEIKAAIERDGKAVVGSHPERSVSQQRPEKLGIYICNRYENVLLTDKAKRISWRVCKVPAAKRLEWMEAH